MPVYLFNSVKSEGRLREYSWNWLEKSTNLKDSLTDEI